MIINKYFLYTIYNLNIIIIYNIIIIKKFDSIYKMKNNYDENDINSYN